MLKDKIEQVLKDATYREREIIKLRYASATGTPTPRRGRPHLQGDARARPARSKPRPIRKLQHPVRARKLEGFPARQRRSVASTVDAI